MGHGQSYSIFFVCLRLLNRRGSPVGAAVFIANNCERKKNLGYYAILTLKSKTDLRSENWQKLYVQNGMQKSEFAWERNTLTLPGLRSTALAPRL